MMLSTRNAARGAACARGRVADSVEGLARLVRAGPAVVLVACLLMVVPAVATDTVASPSRDWLYRVQPGDTLTSIAARLLRAPGNWRTLARLNQLANPNRIPAGAVLRIPVDWLRRIESAGILESVVGDVTIVAQAGQVRRASAGSRFGPGDILQCGPGSTASFRLEDGSSLRLFEDSALRVHELWRYSSTRVFLIRLNLVRGRIENLVAPLVEPASRFEIESPAAVTSVRGTEYRVNALEGRALTEVLHGRIGFANQSGSVEVPGGYGAAVSVGQAPGDPVPLLPAPDVSASPREADVATPVIRWKPVPGAVSYRVQVTGESEGHPVLFDGIAEDARIALPVLSNGDYRVAVRGIDGSGLEGMGADWPLRLDILPAVPDALLPEDGAVLDRGTVRFAWQADRADASGSGIAVEVSREPTFGHIVLALSARDGDEAISGSALPPGRYYWRLKAARRDGRERVGAAHFFDVLPIPVSLPDLTVNTDAAVIEWPPVPGYRYRVQLARDDGFEDLEGEWETVTSRLSLPELPAGQYHVRVATVSQEGVRGRFGPAASVDVAEAAVDPPEMIGPDESAFPDDEPVLLSWHPRERARGYRLQVSADMRFDQILLDRELGPDAVSASIGAEVGTGLRYWRIASKGKTVTGAFGVPHAFRIAPPRPPVRALLLDGASLTVFCPPLLAGQSCLVRVASDAAFRQEVFSERTTTGIVRADLSPGATVFVALSVIDGDGFHGAMGPAERLEVPAPEPVRRPPVWPVWVLPALLLLI